MYAKSFQSCPTLCDPIDGSPPGSPIPGILQARTLEWVAISFSNAWKWKVKVKSLSCVRLLATPWTVAYQAPPSVGFSRQEYWSGVPSRLQDMKNLFSHFLEGNTRKILYSPEKKFKRCSVELPWFKKNFWPPLRYTVTSGAFHAVNLPLENWLIPCVSWWLPYK